jgi:hypothetical protein
MAGSIQFCRGKFRQATSSRLSVRFDYSQCLIDKDVMPWRIEDEMKKLGANYIQAGLIATAT